MQRTPILAAVAVLVLLAVGLLAAYIVVTRVDEPTAPDATDAPPQLPPSTAGKFTEHTVRVDTSGGRPFGEARWAEPGPRGDDGAPAAAGAFEHDVDEVRAGGAEDDDDPADEDARPWPVSAEGIQGAIRARSDELKECYDGWRQLNPELAGRVVVAFTIAPDEQRDDRAAVTQVDIDDTELEHRFMEGCVLRVFEELAFEPPPDGGPTVVNYPLMFRSGADE